jgi:hypothetical protein
MLEPYAVKVARTVLRGGKREISYLSQLDTLVVHTLNDGGYRLGFCPIRKKGLTLEAKALSFLPG